jgi:riboflavin kinase/FMN adenylyltransferase
MRIIYAAKDLVYGRRNVCMAIGFFDGVHLGHQQIIRQTMSDARQHEAVAAVITFDRHPNAVVAPQRVPPLIYSLEQRLGAIEELGVETLLLFHFDRAFSEQTGDQFIRSLTSEAGPVRSICVGANFVFGKKRGGNVDLLKQLGGELHFSVHGMAAVALDGKAVSSTRIREVIAGGNLDAASQMLGRAYSIRGRVVEGDKLGSTLGFPTANIDVTGLALPPNGVYAAHAEVGSVTRRAVLNIGTRPTVSDSKAMLRVEVHLLQFTGDLYGQDLEVTFVEKLREEKKFNSVEELRQQIALDAKQAARILSGM